MNFFSVLDESDNEEPKVVPAKKGAAAPAATGKAAAPAAAKKDAAPAKKDAAPAKKDAPKTAKAVEDKPKRDASKAPKAQEGGEKEAAKDDNRGGHRNRERHGEKQYGTKPDGEKRAPRREFDRRSGTGRGREVSRGGRGAFGAGNPAQDALDAEKNPQAAVEGAIEGAAVEGETTEEAVVEDVTPAEPEPVTFTLDEFLSKREEARQRLAGLTGAPAAVRTVDKEKDFAGLTTVTTGELENYVGSSAAKAEAARKDQRSTGKSVVLNTGFKFPTVQPEREQRDGPRTGGRGGDREGGRGGRREGGAGRGAGRGERPASGRGAPRPASSGAAFNAEKDFPKL